MRLKIILLSMCITYSCSSLDKKNNAKEIIHPVENSVFDASNIAFKIDTNSYSNQLLDRIKNKKVTAKIGQLDGDLNEIFSSIDQVLVENEFVYILDKNNIKISKFSLNGEFVARIGNEGSGPGEYKHPLNISAYRNSLFISDRLFLIIKAEELSESDYKLTNYINLKNTLESACISNDNLIAKSITKLDSNKVNLLKSFDLKTKELKFTFGDPYKGTSDPVGRELLSEGIIGCNNDGIYLAKYISPYVYKYNQEGELEWVSEIDSYKPMRFKETIGEGMTFRWNNDDLFYSEYDSFHFFENRLIVQIQNYSNKVESDNFITKPEKIETYLIDTSNGSGEYLGNKIPDIYYIDETHLILRGNTKYPSIIIYKI